MMDRTFQVQWAHSRHSIKRLLYPVINHNGKEYEKEYVYMCIADSLRYKAETNTPLYNNYTPIKM